MAKKKTATRTAKKAPKKAAKRPAPTTASAADAIRRLDAEFMKAADARNAGALVKAFYAADAVLMPPNHPIVEGRAKIQSFLQGLIDSGFTGIKLETTTVAGAGDLAYGRGRYTLSMAPPGRAPAEDIGKYIVTYRRQANGRWQAVADIFNSDQAQSVPSVPAH
jgi:ketosteroid isomerase-like protein